MKILVLKTLALLALMSSCICLNAQTSAVIIVAKMNLLLLKKVEELTLLLIEKGKEVKKTQWYTASINVEIPKIRDFINQQNLKQEK